MPFKWPGSLLAHSRANVESNVVKIGDFSFAGLRDNTVQVALLSQQPSEAPRQCEKSKNRELKSLNQGHTADKFQSERLTRRQTLSTLLASGLFCSICSQSLPPVICPSASPLHLLSSDVI